MKHIITILTAVAGVVGMASAQSLNVNCGSVTYQFDYSQTGAMTFAGGTDLTILDRTFGIADITNINLGQDLIADNTVKVVYGSSSASAIVAGNIAKYVDVAIEGGHVVVTQSDEVGDDTCGEITYSLSGECADGEFTITGSYKLSIELCGLTLTNPSGAAIDIECGKRTAIRVKEGTDNSLTDGADGSQKAALYCKGHLEFKQKGSLTVAGNKAHAISAKEYIEIKNTKITVTGAKKDGLNCNQYFLMESGELRISGTADDGVQVSYKDDADREAEDTGSITIKGGVLDIDVTAAAAKALKADGDFIMTGGEITATVQGGGLWDAAKKKTKASSCIGADGNLNISGGTLTLAATGGGGKGISIDGNCLISGGTFDITTSGGVVAYVNGAINNNYTGNIDNLNSDYKSSPKGIKVDGDIVIDGGTFCIYTKGKNGEGIESKKTLTINGGDFDIRAYDDGTNSSSHTYINGGNLTITTGAGDAIDSNGNIYVAGGNLVVIGAEQPEQGFDAGDGYSIYITGGTMLAAGGGNSAPSNSNSTQAYVILSTTVTAGTAVAIKDGDTVLASFEIPAKYGDAGSRGPGGPGGGWDWGWGDNNGSSLLISTPDMVSGKTYTIVSGTTTTTSTARTTGGSSGPGGRP